MMRAWAIGGVLASVLLGFLPASAVAAAKVPIFEQGRGTVLAERPTYLDAPRNIAPGSISKRDGWGTIVWQQWGGPAATGTATYFWNTATDLAEYPSKVRLQGLKRCGKNMVYTMIVGTFIGPPPPDVAATVTTPVLPFKCASSATASAAVTRSCGTVSVRFKPDGEGAGVKIRATRIGCTAAKRAVSACLRGSRNGWSIRRASPDPVYGPRVAMRKARAVITFAIVGGGGCGP